MSHWIVWHLLIWINIIRNAAEHFDSCPGKLSFAVTGKQFLCEGQDAVTHVLFNVIGQIPMLNELVEKGQCLQEGHVKPGHPRYWGCTVSQPDGCPSFDYGNKNTMQTTYTIETVNGIYGANKLCLYIHDCGRPMSTTGWRITAAKHEEMHPTQDKDIKDCPTEANYKKFKELASFTCSTWADWIASSFVSEDQQKVAKCMKDMGLNANGELYYSCTIPHGQSCVQYKSNKWWKFWASQNPTTTLQGEHKRPKGKPSKHLCVYQKNCGGINAAHVEDAFGGLMRNEQYYDDDQYDDEQYYDDDQYDAEQYNDETDELIEELMDEIFEEGYKMGYNSGRKTKRKQSLFNYA